MNQTQSNNYSIDNNNIELSLRDYFLILKIHSKKIIFFTLIGLLISIYFVSVKKPEYTAVVTVAVKDKPGAGMVMDMTGNRDRDRMINEIQLIKSRRVVKATIKEIWPNKKNNLALFGSYPFYPRGRRVRTFLKEFFTLGIYNSNMEEPVKYSMKYNDEIGERFVGKLIQNLNATPRKGTDIIDISYTSVWPAEAKLIVNTIAEKYEEFEHMLGSEQAASSLKFLEKLVKDQENDLINSEIKLTEFKKKERMYDLDGSALNLVSQISNVESEVYNFESEINIKQQKYNIGKSRLSAEEKSLTDQLLNNINIQVLSLRGEIAVLESSIIQNEVQYGKNHVAVIELNNRLLSLKKQLIEKVNKLVAQGITSEDPLKSRQEIVLELIALDSEIIGLNLRKKEADKLLNILNTKLNELPPKQLKFSKMQRDISVLNQSYVLLRQKLEEAKINVASQIGRVQIVDYAKEPINSAKDSKRIIIMGLIFGLGFGVALAFSLEFLDNSIKTVDEINKLNLSVLGIIPSIGDENKKPLFNFRKKFGNSNSSKGLKRRLMTREDPKSPVSEAYRGLRTSMLYSSTKSEPKSILVSSAGPGEGKTTTVANLAITYANLGKKTLLVDTDLRRPVVHKVFDLKREPGVTAFLSGSIDNYKKLVQSSGVKNLSLITAGIIPPNPSELLGSDRMARLVKTLENDWDIVLFDSPPLIAVTDATMISQEIDQIVLVIKVGQTDKKAFHHTVSNLRNINAPLSGIIMNAVTGKSSYGSYYYYYYYQYYHYYGSEKNDNKA